MMDKDYLYQIDIREWIERGLDADIMVPVSGNKIDKMIWKMIHIMHIH